MSAPCGPAARSGPFRARPRQARWRLAGVAPAYLVAAALAGCVQVQPQSADVDPLPDRPRVLLMPLDVVVQEVGTSGLPLAHPDWTGKARAAIAGAVEGTLEEREAVLVRYRNDDTRVVPYAETHVPAIRLHRAVRSAIIRYRYRPGGGRSLPTRSEGLEWTLGSSVRALAHDYDADYALFLSYRQTTSTGGRALLTAAAFLLFGAIQPTSQSLGLAMLVDLETGAVVWTNLLRGQALEVSPPDGLRQRGRELLSGLPL